MSLRSPSFLATAALAAGFLAVLTASPAAVAGDKIEFSKPATLLDVPKQHDDKILGKTSTIAAPRPDDDLQQEQAMDATSVVVYTHPRKNSDKSWDALSSDNSDENADDKSPTDNPGIQRRSGSSATNFWDLKWGSDSERGLSRKNDADTVNQNPLHYQMETMKLRENNQYQSDERLEDRVNNARTETTWERSLFHYGITGTWNSHEGQYEQFLDEMKVMNEQSGLSGSSLNPGATTDNSRRDSFTQSTFPGMTTPMDYTGFGKSQGDAATLAVPRTYQAPQSQGLTLNPDPYGRMYPPAAPAGQVQSPPAVLPFPKRPGSVFQ